MGATLVSPRRPRVAAQERRDLVLDAAVAEFGAHGWHGARIEAIAARAGISHPYLLRLFASKRKLFMTTTDRAFDRMEAAFTEPVAHDEDDPILALGEARPGHGGPAQRADERGAPGLARRHTVAQTRTGPDRAAARRAVAERAAR